VIRVKVRVRVDNFCVIIFAFIIVKKWVEELRINGDKKAELASVLKDINSEINN